MKPQISKLKKIVIAIYGDVCGKRVALNIADDVNNVAVTKRNPFNYKVTETSRAIIYRWVDSKNKKEWQIRYNVKNHVLEFLVASPEFSNTYILFRFDTGIDYNFDDTLKAVWSTFKKAWSNHEVEHLRQYYNLEKIKN